MEITVKVEEKHIAAGRRYECTECPIALAIREQYKEVKMVKVWDGEVELYINNCEYYAFVPTEITEWINDFDSAMPVKPVEFKSKCYPVHI